MKRRDVLLIAAGAGIGSLGVGAYVLLDRDEDGPIDRLGGRTPADADAPPEGDTPHEFDEEVIEAPGDADAETRDGDFLIGVSPPARDPSVLDPHEAWLDRQYAVVGYFVDTRQDEAYMDGIVEDVLEPTWRRGSVPHVFFQPFFPERSNTVENTLTEIHEGEWDEPLEQWADRFARWARGGEGSDRRLYLNFAPEFNGDWAPWSPAIGAADDEAAFVGMWRHVHDIMTDAGLTADHVQWLWTLDNTTRGVDREASWPGEDYVDWVGLHGYNWQRWGGWRPPEALYGRTIDVIRSITDAPIALTEFGCSSETGDGGHDPAGKDAWIREVYAYFIDRGIRMGLWFDIDKETDWAVFDVDPHVATVEIGGTEYGKYPGYREAVTGPAAIPRHPDHSRRLTDEEFRGEF